MKPTLVVMAAGLGSRFGGLKQLEAMGPNGEWILEYALYDALRAGFKRVVMVIQKINEEFIKSMIDSRITNQDIEILYAYQALEDIPKGKTFPKGRTKPWGTGQAVLAVKDLVKGAISVINADDYYGPKAYRLMYDHLIDADENTNDFAMVGYSIQSTLSDSGSVSRGVCEVDQDNMLRSIVERTHIIKTSDGPMYTEDKYNYIRLAKSSIVSMNMWGFTKGIIKGLADSFDMFFDNELAQNPLKAELYLPTVVKQMMDKKTAKVKVYKSDELWYGVTYKEDVAPVRRALASLHENGLYPKKLWK